jgi:membrane protease YdiL (CAAX protease family)
LCYCFRIVEYIFIRTDRTIIGEAFIHKLIGIIILAIVLRYLQYHWREIGFTKNAAVRGTLLGLLLGVAAFAIAYGAEMIIQQMNGNSPALRVYVSSYSITGNNVMQTNVLFFAVCILGNLINVIMEEGIFRGLFVKLFEKKTSFTAAVLCSSLLFGLWHIAAPLRELLDGNMQISSFVMASLMQVLLTGIMGILLCLLVKVTGSIWTAMAVHFTNNFIVNILHVVTQSGADELQIIRISIAQTITFLVVLSIYIAKKSYRQQTFR